MPKYDIVIFDEFDETLLDCPYEFLPNSETSFNGVWDLAKYQVVALSATAQNNIQVIIEDVISGRGGVEMLEFLSEYEFVTGKSHLQGDIVILPKDANIVEHMAKSARRSTVASPLYASLRRISTNR